MSHSVVGENDVLRYLYQTSSTHSCTTPHSQTASTSLRKQKLLNRNLPSIPSWIYYCPPAMFETISCFLPINRKEKLKKTVRTRLVQVCGRTKKLMGVFSKRKRSQVVILPPHQNLIPSQVHKIPSSTRSSEIFISCFPSFYRSFLSILNTTLFLSRSKAFKQ